MRKSFGYVLVLTALGFFGAQAHAGDIVMNPNDFPTKVGCGSPMPDHPEFYIEYCAGTISSNFAIDQNKDLNFVIRAAGMFAGGAWPIMQLTVDGVVTSSWLVNRSTPRRYSVFVPNVSAGAHTIGVSFLNDFYDPSLQKRTDRNLFVGPIVIGSDLND